MRKYKLYVYVPNEIDPPKVQDYEGADDEAALGKARSIGASHTVEIWEAGRLVAHIGKDGEIKHAQDKRLS